MDGRHFFWAGLWTGGKLGTDQCLPSLSPVLPVVPMLFSNPPGVPWFARATSSRISNACHHLRFFSDLSVPNSPRRFLLSSKTQKISPKGDKSPIRGTHAAPALVSLKLRQSQRIPDEIHFASLHKSGQPLFSPDRGSLPKHATPFPLARPHRRLALALPIYLAILVFVTTLLFRRPSAC